MDREVYIQGEKFAVKLTDATYAAVTFKYGTNAATLTKSSGVWSATIDTSALSGVYNYALLADDTLIERGRFSVSPLVSKYRAVVEKIDAAIQSWGTNAAQSVTIGEINTTFKTLDQLLAAKSHYTALADAEESGTIYTSGPRRLREVYA